MNDNKSENKENFNSKRTHPTALQFSIIIFAIPL
jgi:hypothetical protein